jgi:single-strand DNA-binding protein
MVELIMANFNKVLLMGNLTRDPQLSYLPSQTAVVDFGLATNRKYKGQDGSMKEDTCFVDCQAFGKTAENINKYCKKGNPLFVEGRLKFDSWTAQDGTKRSKHRVTVENFQFLGGGQAGGAPASQMSSASAVEQTYQPDEPAQGQGQTGDDIPF